MNKLHPQKILGFHNFSLGKSNKNKDNFYLKKMKFTTK